MVVPTGAYIPQMAGLTDSIAAARPGAASRTSRTSTRSTSGRPGTRATSTRSARTGARPAGSTTTPSSPSPSTPGPTSSLRPRAWRAATCRCSARPPNLMRHLLLGQRHPWTTEDPADLDACEAFIVDEFASHIKAFDSYPGHQPHLGQLHPVAGLERRRPPRPALGRSTIPTGTPGVWAHRSPSSGWTTGAS